MSMMRKYHNHNHIYCILYLQKSDKLYKLFEAVSTHTINIYEFNAMGRYSDHTCFYTFTLVVSQRIVLNKMPPYMDGRHS